MPNERVQPRLTPVMHAYLQDLADLGAYGKDKTDVARTLIEGGICQALADKIIKARSARK